MTVAWGLMEVTQSILRIHAGITMDNRTASWVGDWDGMECKRREEKLIAK